MQADLGQDSAIALQDAPVEVREATADDGAAVGRMHLACWREAYSHLLPADFWDGETEARWIERWRRTLARPVPGATTRTAVQGGQVLGFATAGPARPNSTAGAPVRQRELWALHVRAAEHGSGLAGRLLEAVLPAGPAELWVLEANARARAFSARHGFAPDGARHVFGPDLGDQPEIRMVR